MPYTHDDYKNTANCTTYYVENSMELNGSGLSDSSRTAYSQSDL